MHSIYYHVQKGIFIVKNLRMVLFAALFGIYIIGVVTGSIHQVKTDNQAEMYSYLDTAVSGYEAEVADSIKSVAKDRNLPKNEIYKIVNT